MQNDAYSVYMYINIYKVFFNLYIVYNELNIEKITNTIKGMIKIQDSDYL